MSMPRNERKEDAFLSPAVETYAYRYVTLPSAVSEGDENGVALGSSNLSTSNLSQWHHCESQGNQGRHSQKIKNTQKTEFQDIFT
jgi:hypothetical protein